MTNLIFTFINTVEFEGKSIATLILDERYLFVTKVVKNVSLAKQLDKP